MRTLTLAVIPFLFVLLCSNTDAYTLTFDDVPSGQNLNYYTNQYGIGFFDLNISDHSISTWGPPHSGSKVLAGQGGGWNELQLKGPAHPDHATLLSAYFGTAQGTVVRMGFYDWGTLLTSVDIGEAGSAWSNRYVTVSPLVPFNRVLFLPVSSGDPLAGYSLDDLTIVPIPEPSSLLALAGGLGAIGFLRRRK